MKAVKKGLNPPLVEERKLTIQDMEERVKREVERIKNSDGLTDQDVETLMEYKRDMEIQGLTSNRIHKVLYQTRKIACRLD